MLTEIDTATIRAAQAGDEAATRRVIEGLHRPVLGTIHRFLGPRFRADVEDIAQEVFLKVFRALDRFDPDRGVKFTTWVYTFVRNHCFDILKRRRLTTVSISPRDDDDGGLDPVDPDSAAPADGLSNAELGEKIEAALQSLGNDQRLAFVLREFEGMDYAAIAEVMGVSEGTVKSRLHRAKAALRQHLSPYVRTGS